MVGAKLVVMSELTGNLTQLTNSSSYMVIVVCVKFYQFYHTYMHICKYALMTREVGS